MVNESCPSAADLGAFHRGDLPLDQAERLAAHLESCPTCEASLQRLDEDERSVAGLLRDDGSSAFETVGTPGARAGAADRSASVHVGRYKLIEPLGEGGMGAVFMAQQSEPVRRLVAIKLIRPGMDSRQILARFEAERQALALMDHPNIARVLDAGATATGQPYFAMELVKGVPITQYCDDHRLSVRDRLELFVPVCRAVQHAHQKGIIHRDIKPSNVLVARYDGEPVPKVIDFGVAKAIGQPLTDMTLVTNFGSVVGTPEYMAPEQAEMNQADVDTRCDVYALGVLLYQLLAGSTPLTRQRMGEAAIFEILRLVREEEAPRPSTRLSSSDALPSLAACRKAEPDQLAALLRGELDWVAMRALEKDRDRRYDTPGALARDVERYLADEPVEAAPPTASYRFRKFARRHRGAIRLAGLVAVLLVAATTVSTWQAIRATRAEGRADDARRAAERAEQAVRIEGQAKQVALDRARAEEQKVKDELATREAITDYFIKSVFVAGRPLGAEGGLGSDVTLRKAIDVAVDRMGQALQGRPMVEARLRKEIGDTYYFLDDFRVAAAQLQEAYDLTRTHLGPNHLDTIALAVALAEARVRYGETRTTIPVLEDAVRDLRAAVGPADRRVLGALGILGHAYATAGRTDQAIGLIEENLRQRRQQGVLDDEIAINEAVDLADTYIGVDRIEDAYRLLQDFAPIARQLLGPRHPSMLVVLHRLAQCEIRLERPADAIPRLQAVLEDAKLVLGVTNQRTSIVMNELARAFSQAERYDEAIALDEANLAALRAKQGSSSFPALTVANNLASSQLNAKRFDDAIRLFGELVELQRAKHGPDHVETIVCLGALARGNLVAGRPEAARRLVADVLAGVGDRPAVDALRIAERLAQIGVAYLNLNLPIEAEAPLRACLAIRLRCKPDGWLAANARALLGAALAARDPASWPEAEALLRDGYAGLRASAGTIPPRGRSNLPAALDSLIRLAEVMQRPDQVSAWKAERSQYPAQYRPAYLR